MPRNLQLPDGRTLVLDDNMTPEQSAALKAKLREKYGMGDPLQTASPPPDQPLPPEGNRWRALANQLRTPAAEAVYNISPLGVADRVLESGILGDEGTQRYRASPANRMLDTARRAVTSDTGQRLAISTASTAVPVVGPMVAHAGMQAIGLEEPSLETVALAGGLDAVLRGGTSVAQAYDATRQIKNEVLKRTPGSAFGLEEIGVQKLRALPRFMANPTTADALANQLRQQPIDIPATKLQQTIQDLIQRELQVGSLGAGNRGMAAPGSKLDWLQQIETELFLHGGKLPFPKFWDWWKATNARGANKWDALNPGIRHFADASIKRALADDLNAAAQSVPGGSQAAQLLHDFNATFQRELAGKTLQQWATSATPMRKHTTDRIPQPGKVLGKIEQSPLFTKRPAVARDVPAITDELTEVSSFPGRPTPRGVAAGSLQLGKRAIGGTLGGAGAAMAGASGPVASAIGATITLTPFAMEKLGSTPWGRKIVRDIYNGDYDPKLARALVQMGLATWAADADADTLGEYRELRDLFE